MLIITRNIGEAVQIGDDVVITIEEIRRGRVTIGIDAPLEVDVMRGELVEDDDTENTKGGE